VSLTEIPGLQDAEGMPALYRLLAKMAIECGEQEAALEFISHIPLTKLAQEDLFNQEEYSRELIYAQQKQEIQEAQPDLDKKSLAELLKTPERMVARLRPSMVSLLRATAKDGEDSKERRAAGRLANLESVLANLKLPADRMGELYLQIGLDCLDGEKKIPATSDICLAESTGFRQCAGTIDA